MTKRKPKARPKRKPSSPPGLVPAVDVAAASGRDPRTIRAWVARRELSGVVKSGRCYVHLPAARELLSESAELGDVTELLARF